MSSPSASLALWATAWLAGSSAPDDVLDALSAWAPRHIVGVDGSDDSGAMGLLKSIRCSAPRADSVRLVLPVPGDVRGVPLGTEFATAAIDAGEGVLVGEPGGPGTGIVPVQRSPEAIRWTVFEAIVPAQSDETSLGEAEFAMREAVREAADALAKLQSVAVGSKSRNPRARIEAALAADAKHRYPDSLPTRARRVLETAEHVAAILTLAEAENPSAPTSASSAATREAVLRPLWDAVRSARLAAVRATATIA